MTRIALDTSVAVPYVLRSHEAHTVVQDHLAGRGSVLTGHSLAETYSVLTRLPDDARVTPDDAVALIDANFGEPILLDRKIAAVLPNLLASKRVSGGAVYDAMVGLAAGRAEVPLATRDRRAAATYAALGVSIELLLG